MTTRKFARPARLTRRQPAPPAPVPAPIPQEAEEANGGPQTPQESPKRTSRPNPPGLDDARLLAAKAEHRILEALDAAARAIWLQDDEAARRILEVHLMPLAAVWARSSATILEVSGGRAPIFRTASGYAALLGARMEAKSAD